MLGTLKVVFLTLTALAADIRPADGDSTKRDSNGHQQQQPGVEVLHLGHFGPVSRLSSHPTFAPLGLTPHQTGGFLTLLLQNALLAPHALRYPGGHPLSVDSLSLPPRFPVLWPPSLLSPLPPPFGPPIDPYFLLLMTDYARLLPPGLGPQGFYGSTGLPRPRPLPPLSYTDKN